MSLITIIGAGQMASALTYPLTDNGHTVRLVGTPLDDAIIDGLKKDNYHITLKRPIPASVSFHYFSEAEDALKGADLVMGGVSSFGLDWFVETVIPMLDEKVPVITVTKGMINENGNLISYPEYFEKMTDKNISFNAIGGPCTSYELADRDFSCVTFCGRSMETLRWLKGIFSTNYYTVSLSTDVRGVECAVAMKNAYALAVCLAIGMSYKREGREFEHYNSQAALFGQSVKEMTALLDLCGGHPSNLYLGAGDLYVTVYGGRTRKIGTLLGQEIPFSEAMEILKGVTLESIVIASRTAAAVRACIADGRAKTETFPLILHVDSLINEGATVNIPWEKFAVEFEL